MTLPVESSKLAAAGAVSATKINREDVKKQVGLRTRAYGHTGETGNASNKNESHNKQVSNFSLGR